MSGIKTLPLYPLDQTFQYYANHGPTISFPIPPRIFPPEDQWLPFIDFKLASPIGIPACAIMTGKGIELMAQLGYDVLTYKTIRSVAHPTHPSPNIMYVDLIHQMNPTDILASFAGGEPPTDASTIAITNSFGNGSFDPTWTMQDIAYTRSKLYPGQLLIVSVVGTHQTSRSFIQDFAYTAQLAFESGAHLIELNLSCPNLNDQPIYTDLSLVEQICKSVHTQLKNMPRSAKIGFTDRQHLEKLLVILATHGFQAVTAINSVPVQVQQNGTPVFGPNRQYSGLSGNPIRNLARTFIQNMDMIIKKEKLDLTILATGGITQPNHFQEFFNVGATIAMSATGTMWNPYLALQFHETKGTYYEDTTTSFYQQR